MKAAKQLLVTNEQIIEKFYEHKQILFDSIFKVTKIHVKQVDLNPRQDVPYIQKVMTPMRSRHLDFDAIVGNLFIHLTNGITKKVAADFVELILEPEFESKELLFYMFSEEKYNSITNIISKKSNKNKFKELLLKEIFEIQYSFKDVLPNIPHKNKLFNLFGSICETRLQNHLINTENDWSGVTDYVENDVIWHVESYYRCNVSHTSGIFADDLVAGKWDLLSGIFNITINHQLATKFVEAILDERVGDEIVQIIFVPTKSDEILEIKTRFKQSHKNIRFSSSGLQLEQHIEYVEGNTFFDIGECKDIAADSCGNVFVLKHSGNTIQVYKYYGLDNMDLIYEQAYADISDYSFKIQVNDYFIYLLEITLTNTDIRIISRRKKEEINIIKIDMLNSELVQDITVDRHGILLILSSSGYVYEVSSHDPLVVSRKRKLVTSNNVEDCTNQEMELGDESPPITDIIKIRAGKNVEKIYCLHDDDRTVTVYDHGITKLHEFRFPKEVIDFEAYDSFNITVLREELGAKIVETYTSVIVSPMKIVPMMFKEGLEPSEIFCQSSTGDLFFIVDENSEKHILQMQMTEKFVEQGEIILGPFDSCVWDTEWHKIVTKMSRLPYRKTKNFELEHFAENILNENIPDNWKKLKPDPENVLIDSIGRFLWLKLILKSPDGENSPAFKSMIIDFPKSTYLRYLPKIYQENKQSRRFLEQYLSLFETIFERFDKRIFDFYKMLDSNATEKQFLVWLASWLGLDNIVKLPETNLRNLLANYGILMKMHGTVDGLRHFVGFCIDENYTIKDSISQKIALDEGITKCSQHPQVMIVENSKLNSCTSIDAPDKHTEHLELYGNDPYTFTILLPPYNIDFEKQKIIRTIVEKEKPAHTIAKVCQLSPLFILGSHTYLGINSGLNTKSLIVDSSSVGYSFTTEVN